MLAACGKDTDTTDNSDAEQNQTSTLYDESGELIASGDGDISMNTDATRTLRKLEDMLAGNYLATIGDVSITEPSNGDEDFRITDGFSARGENFEAELYQYSTHKAAADIYNLNVKTFQENEYDGASTYKEGNSASSDDGINKLSWMRVMNEKVYFVGVKDDVLMVIRSTEDNLEEVTSIVSALGFHSVELADMTTTTDTDTTETGDVVTADTESE